MLGRLNHVAIAVKDAEKAAKIYGGAFGAEISGAVPLPEHGVITVFVTLPNTKIEFIQPLGEASPIAKFVERNADGGIHHICYDVPDIIAARDTLIARVRACSATACRRSAPTASRCCFSTRRIFPARSSKSNRLERRWPTASPPRLRSTSCSGGSCCS